MTEAPQANSPDEQPADSAAETPPAHEPTGDQDDAEHQEEGGGEAETRRRDSLRKEIRAGWQRALGH